jgi:hypothetical protein
MEILLPLRRTRRMGQSAGNKGKEVINESGDNTTANSQQASRPRTSRENRPNSKVRRRSGGGSNGGGNSALGFNSNAAHHHLLYNNPDNVKKIHNRSVNEVIDSPRNKKRKFNKGRASPNTFVAHHQRHPSAAGHNINPKRNASLEAEKVALIGKSRPHSAKLK